MSLSTGVVPDKLKLARVIALYKKGDDTLPSNYRPISLLSVLDKLLEKIVYRRLIEFLDMHKVIINNQFGFRKNHTTTMALLHAIETCYREIDKNNYVLGIFFDLQKAFDTVDHNILLDKLQNYGIRGLMHKWITSYLSHRKQFTVVNDCHSQTCELSCGIPQGSVLGPLLFILYVNDIQNAVPDAQLELFADDTNMFKVGSNLSTLQTEANNDLSKLQEWFLANKLSINIDKTNYCIFAPKSERSSVNVASLNIVIGNQAIQRVETCKYLGVTLDDRLKWDSHINSIYNKIIKFTSLLYKIRPIVPLACLKKLYYALIYPHLLYGIEIYANTSKTHLDKLCKLNNKLLRILLNKPLLTPVTDLYNEINHAPIPVLHQIRILIFIKKCIHHKDLTPELYQHYFNQNNTVHTYNTRRNLDLHTNSFSSSLGQRSILSFGVKLWNELPKEFKADNTSIKLFNNNIKKYLVSKYT